MFNCVSNLCLHIGVYFYVSNFVFLIVCVCLCGSNFVCVCVCVCEFVFLLVFAKFSIFKITIKHFNQTQFNNWHCRQQSLSIPKESTSRIS